MPVRATGGRIRGSYTDRYCLALPLTLPLPGKGGAAPSECRAGDLVCPWAQGGRLEDPGRTVKVGHTPAQGRHFSDPSPPCRVAGPGGSPGMKSPSSSSSSSSSSESSGQDSGVELLSVTWLWPEGWSLALRWRRSGPGPWREMEPLQLGAHPGPPQLCPQGQGCAGLEDRAALEDEAVDGSDSGAVTAGPGPLCELTARPPPAPRGPLQWDLRDWLTSGNSPEYRNGRGVADWRG